MPGTIEEMSSLATDAATDDPKSTSTPSTTSKLPRGIVLGPDGKPCRTCTSSSAWMSMMKSSSSTSSNQSTTTPTTSPPPPLTVTPHPSTQPLDCPPDVDDLGRSTWTLLHTMTATYPERPTPSHSAKTTTFLRLFAQLYPCWVCAEDFQSWVAKPENEPATGSREEFGRWMCRAHNEVNRKLGKGEFDCDLWKERWRDGSRDGRCG